MLAVSAYEGRSVGVCENRLQRLWDIFWKPEAKIWRLHVNMRSEISYLRILIIDNALFSAVVILYIIRNLY